MASKKLSKTQAVIDILLSEPRLNAADIAKKVEENTGKTMSGKEASTLLAKLLETELGNFIEKGKEDSRYVYKIIEDARCLTVDQAHGLSLKTGNNRYTLEQALEAHPHLEKYVRQEEEKKKEKEEKPSRKRTTKKSGTSKAGTSKAGTSKERTSRRTAAKTENSPPKSAPEPEPTPEPAPKPAPKPAPEPATERKITVTPSFMGVENLLAGLMKIIGGGKDINVNLKITVTFE